uniref:Uncharacterized protein n=1 Tax=Setaria viridis TaxID=4556 RepID=A0A4U6TS09_SETVI|nr:hypothetical protein SEVIR_8G104300v2 [Setaria viridis]
MSKSEHPVVNEGKDRVKHNGKKPKLTFDELLAKYQKDNEDKRANRSYNVEYIAPRESSCARQPYVENDRFEQKDLSSVQKKKKVAKQVYRVKRNGHKDKSSELNPIDEKPINVLKISAINGREKGKPKKKLQKLSTQELRKKGMAWVPKGSIQTQNKDDSLHYPFALQMSYMFMSWNSSLDMFGYPSCSYFDPWMPHGSLYYGGLSPNCYAY